jgi:A/G-specific adenine glycosylase
MRMETRFRRAVIGWSGEHPRSFPWRETSDPYAVLVGEVLLQRTRGEHVPKVYTELLRRWPTPQRLARARVSSIATVIRPLGLSKRAASLKALGQAIAALGEVPLEPADLDLLPGVGPYASHAVPVFSKGRDLPLVDWVVARVLRRFFGLPEGRRPSADPDLWNLAARLASGGEARRLWLGTLDFAAAVCRPRPKCDGCPLARDCSYLSIAGWPVSAARGRVTHV